MKIKKDYLPLDYKVATGYQLRRLSTLSRKINELNQKLIKLLEEIESNGEKNTRSS
jgi:hypothetical protein